MASSIVSQMQDKGKSDDDIISTVLITLSLCTMLLGIALILTGYFKLAQLVQYLPMPVVGGYLAFIGLYCGEHPHTTSVICSHSLCSCNTILHCLRCRA